MTSRDLPTAVVLHLGAHKTASTHLQQSIYAANRSGSVKFLGPRKLRDPGQTLPDRFGFPLDPAKSAALPAPPAGVLSGLANGAARLVFSDENFAGKLQTGWGRIPTPLYFTAPARIGALTQAIAGAGGPPLDLCLGIRDPAGYLTSSYSQILHGRRVVKPEKFRAKNPFGIVDWVDYIARLRAVSHVGSVTVWRYEDYATLFPQICMTLLGTDRVTPAAGRAQQRLSAKAMEAILLAKSLEFGNVVAEAAATYPVSGGFAPYALYDPADHLASAALYAAQWAALITMDGITTLQAQ